MGFKIAFMLWREAAHPKLRNPQFQTCTIILRIARLHKSVSEIAA